MELTCQCCGQHFQRTKKGRQPKYCPDCRKLAYRFDLEQWKKLQKSVRRQNAILKPGPAHGLSLSTVLQELERFNAIRRAEGQSVLSYGKYVAMRDKYVYIGR